MGGRRTAGALWSVQKRRQLTLRVLVACTLLSFCSSCVRPGVGGLRETYNPNVDHVTFEKMQQARTDEANGNYQAALKELLQIDAQGDFAKPVGADAGWSITPQSPEYHQLRLWEDHQAQLSWTREMIGDIYAEGRVGAQDLPNAVAWYQKAIDTSGAGFSTERTKFKARLYV